MRVLKLLSLVAGVAAATPRRRGRLELLAPDGTRQPRDVEVDVDGGILSYSSNAKPLKEKRRIARTLAGARAHEYADRPFAFEVEFSSGEHMKWICGSAEDRDAWLGAIASAATVLARRQRAAAAMIVKPLAPRGGCPKVFVYDLPRLWDYSTPLAAFADLAYDKVLGRRCDLGVADEYGTNQFYAGLIVIWRLLRDSRCATRARRPEDADLFLAPTWPARRDPSDWSDYGCGDPDLDRHLQYLDNRTAHRHLFILGKGHPNNACRWWVQKKVRAGLPDLLTRAMRFAYSPPYRGPRTYGPTPLDDDVVAAQRAADPGEAWDRKVGYPHLVSIPYPAGVHARHGTRPWAAVVERRRLAVFVGDQHGRARR
jgi:hypothetical protein